MFSALFQTGQCGIEVLSPSGKNPPSRLLKINGPSTLVIKDYEREIKGFKYTLAGKNSQSSSIQCPASTRDSLALTQPILVLQLKSLQSGDPLNLEIVVLDSNNQRRRFLISTTFKVIDINAHHAQIPWFQDNREIWTNVVFDLQYLSQQCFSVNFGSIDSFHLRPVCSLRKVFTLPASLRQETQFLMVPASFDFPFGTVSKTFMFSMTPPPSILNAKEINAQVPAVGLTVAGQQIGRKRASSVEKKRVESSPLRRGIVNPAQFIPNISTTNSTTITPDVIYMNMHIRIVNPAQFIPNISTINSTTVTPDISIQTGRLKRSDILISAGNRAMASESNTISESRPPQSNTENKKFVLNNVNQKHVLPPQDRQEYMSMADRDQAEVLERLLSATHNNRNNPDNLHLPLPPSSHTLASSSTAHQVLPYNLNSINEVDIEKKYRDNENRNNANDNNSIKNGDREISNPRTLLSNRNSINEQDKEQNDPIKRQNNSSSIAHIRITNSSNAFRYGGDIRDSVESDSSTDQPIQNVLSSSVLPPTAPPQSLLLERGASVSQSKLLIEGGPEGVPSSSSSMIPSPHTKSPSVLSPTAPSQLLPKDISVGAPYSSIIPSPHSDSRSSLNQDKKINQLINYNNNDIEDERNRSNENDYNTMDNDDTGMAVETEGRGKALKLLKQLQINFENEVHIETNFEELDIKDGIYEKGNEAILMPLPPISPSILKASYDSKEGDDRDGNIYENERGESTLMPLPPPDSRQVNNFDTRSIEEKSNDKIDLISVENEIKQVSRKEVDNLDRSIKEEKNCDDGINFITENYPFSGDPLMSPISRLLPLKIKEASRRHVGNFDTASTLERNSIDLTTVKNESVPLISPVSPVIPLDKRGEKSKLRQRQLSSPLLESFTLRLDSILSQLSHHEKCYLEEYGEVM